MNYCSRSSFFLSKTIGSVQEDRVLVQLSVIHYSCIQKHFLVIYLQMDNNLGRGLVGIIKTVSPFFC